MFAIKRIYELPADADGWRVLVDRLWPRGVARDRAHLDEWLKDAAPSPALRAWFGHKSENFDEFSRLYRAELAKEPAQKSAVARLLEIEKTRGVTLVYAAKSETINHAAVLRAFLLEQKSLPD
jgi:uncharacterized protein YeaO (DUF488 family)